MYLLFSDKCYNVLEYRYDQKHKSVYNLQSLKILSIVWTPENDQTCLAITYTFLPSSKIGISMNVFGENNTLITSNNFQKFVSATYNCYNCTFMCKNRLKVYVFHRMAQQH